MSGYVRMSRATPVRSRHVVVTMMARSITVERSGTALFGLARVSRIGMGMGMGTGFSFIRASEVNLEEFFFATTGQLEATLSGRRGHSRQRRSKFSRIDVAPS